MIKNKLNNIYKIRKILNNYRALDKDLLKLLKYAIKLKFKKIILIKIHLFLKIFELFTNKTFKKMVCLKILKQIK